jgi:hypothetical protein
MFQIAAGYEGKVIVADDLTAVAYHTASTGSILHKVQLHDLMAVDRVVEFFLVAICHIHKVVLTQRGNLA